MPLRKSRSSKRSRTRSRSRSRSRNLRGGSNDLPPNSEGSVDSVGGNNENEEERKENGFNGVGGNPTLESFGSMFGGKRKGRRGRRSGKRGGRSGSSGRSSDAGRSGSDGGASKSRRGTKGGFVGLVQDALVPLGLLWMQNRSKKNKGHKLMGGKRRKSRKSRGGDDIA